MTTEHFITELFCRVDDRMADVVKHSQARLYLSDVVTLALLFTLKRVGNRPFYHRLKRDYPYLFPIIFSSDGVDQGVRSPGVAPMPG